MLRIATGGQAFATRTGEAGLSRASWSAACFVPTDGNGRVWPWFNGSSRDRYVSAGSVHVRGRRRQQRIAGHMVVVGTSAVGLEDFRATPVANFMPGVEIHAQIIENILTQQFLFRPTYAIGMELVSRLGRRAFHHLAGSENRRVLCVLRRRLGSRHGRLPARSGPSTPNAC